MNFHLYYSFVAILYKSIGKAISLYITQNRSNTVMKISDFLSLGHWARAGLLLFGIFTFNGLNIGYAYSHCKLGLKNFQQLRSRRKEIK